MNKNIHAKSAGIMTTQCHKINILFQCPLDGEHIKIAANGSFICSRLGFRLIEGGELEGRPVHIRCIRRDDGQFVELVACDIGEILGFEADAGVFREPDAGCAYGCIQEIAAINDDIGL